MNIFLEHLYNALTYSENWWFFSLNFLALIISLIPFLVAELKNRVHGWWWVFIVALLIQASFWFALNVQGISIIWNAMLGALLLFVIRNNKSLNSKISVVVGGPFLLLLVLDIYFAVLLPSITTVAHGCAILMGFLLGVVFLKK